MGGNVRYRHHCFRSVLKINIFVFGNCFVFRASNFRFNRVRKVCMRSLSALIAVCLAALAIGCASTQTVPHEVNFDYDVNADFSSMKTYQWVEMPATQRIDEFNRSRIREYADAELGAKGFQIAEDNPDIFVVMFGGSYKAVDMTVLMDYDVYTVGRLKLAIFDAVSKQEIWWGETKADLMHNMTPAEKDDVTKAAVTRILEYYPPQR